MLQLVSITKLSRQGDRNFDVIEQENFLKAALCSIFFRHSMDWSDLESKKRYEKYEQYSRTKLMLHMTTFKLSRILENSGVTCNVLEPGVIETKLLRLILFFLSSDSDY